MGDSETLEQIEIILVMNLIDNKEDEHAIQLLHRAGYAPTEIGEFIGMNPSTVRTKISRLRKAGEIDA